MSEKDHCFVSVVPCYVQECGEESRGDTDLGFALLQDWGRNSCTYRAAHHRLVWAEGMVATPVGVKSMDFSNAVSTRLQKKNLPAPGQGVQSS